MSDEIEPRKRDSKTSAEGGIHSFSVVGLRLSDVRDSNEVHNPHVRIWKLGQPGVAGAAFAAADLAEVA